MCIYEKILSEYIYIYIYIYEKIRYICVWKGFSLMISEMRNCQ